MEMVVRHSLSQQQRQIQKSELPSSRLGLISSLDCASAGPGLGQIANLLKFSFGPFLSVLADWSKEAILIGPRALINSVSACAHPPGILALHPPLLQQEGSDHILPSVLSVGPPHKPHFFGVS